MFTLLILLLLALAAYLILSAVASRGRARTGESVAEFNRALAALDPQRQRRRRAAARRRARAARSPGARRHAA